MSWTTYFFVSFSSLDYFLLPHSFHFRAFMLRFWLDYLLLRIVSNVLDILQEAAGLYTTSTIYKIDSESLLKILGSPTKRTLIFILKSKTAQNLDTIVGASVLIYRLTLLILGALTSSNNLVARPYIVPSRPLTI